MREDVEKLLKELYERTCRWQRRNGITVELTQAEFDAKWSQYRIRKLETLLDKSPSSVRAYLRNPNTKPVCGWVNADARLTGKMTDANCNIMMAMDQRKLFQFKLGDRHSEETREVMRKPKSDKAKKNMSKGATRRWENYRAEQAASKGE